jgi:hypothetical protein
VRSDAIDHLFSAYLQQPAKVSWEGALSDSIRGVFEGGRLELSGVAVLALPVNRLVLESERFQFVPGLPARIGITRPRVEFTIDQSQIDRWLARGRAPYELALGPAGIEFRMDVAGFPVSRVETTLAVQQGWFLLRPKRAAFFGLESRLASLFRAYIPLPRLAPETRLTRIEHVEGEIRLELTLDDFEDELTPGLVKRLKTRFLPFGGWSGG